MKNARLKDAQNGYQPSSCYYDCLHLELAYLNQLSSAAACFAKGKAKKLVGLRLDFGLSFAYACQMTKQSNFYCLDFQFI